MSVVDDGAWEAQFENLFPAYLLPSAVHAAIDRRVAESLVRRVLGAGGSFAMFRASTFVAACRAEIEAFSTRALPDLCRSLRGRTEVVPDANRGRLVGRLDPARTLALRMRGDFETIASRKRVRRYDHPSEVAVRAVAERLHSTLTTLRRTWGATTPSWAASASAWERSLRSALGRTTLRFVAREPFASLDSRVLLGQRHPAFAIAEGLLRALHESLDSNDPACISRWVSRGALWPLEPWQRFELAVALSLAKSIETRLSRDAPSRWTIRHAVVDTERDDIVAFECADGRRIRMFYNQSPISPGVRSSAVEHYFGNCVASRPDVVIVGESPGRSLRALVIEVKLSNNPSYLSSGFDEALVYALDYSKHLVFPAGSVLVTPSALRGRPRADDAVVAYGWPDWHEPKVVLDAVLATVGGSA